MSDDERRDDEIHEDEHDDERDDTPADAGDPPAGTPRTWAGRSRAGEDESTGMTEEFDSVEQELSAELSGEEPHAEEEADSADELEEPPDEFEFDEDEDEDEG